MIRFAAPVLALGLALGASGLAASPAAAQGFGFVVGPSGGMHVVGGYGFGPGHPHPGHGWRQGPAGAWDHAPHWRGGGGHHWGGGYRGCRVVMMTRWSHRFGGYVRRPIEVCH